MAVVNDAGFPRDIPVPEGCPPGWRQIEYMYKSGACMGKTYIRFNHKTLTDTKHKGLASLKAVILRDAEDHGKDPQKAFQEYEEAKRLKAEAKAKEREEQGFLKGEKREEALQLFRKLHGSLDGKTVENFPNWRSEREFLPTCGQTHVTYYDGDGRPWKLLKDIEAMLGHKIQAGEDITSIMGTNILLKSKRVKDETFKVSAPKRVKDDDANTIVGVGTGKTLPDRSPKAIVDKSKSFQSCPAELRDDAVQIFRANCSPLDGRAVENFPGWRCENNYIATCAQTHAIYFDPGGKPWRLLKDIEAMLGNKMRTGEDVTAIMGTKPWKRAREEEKAVEATDSEVELLEPTGNDVGEGYQMQRSKNGAWVVFPDDTIRVDMIAIGERIERSGWKCASKTEKRRSFTGGDVNLVLFESGKLLIKHTGRGVAHKMATRYAHPILTEGDL